jgi:hypothetical protein
MLLSVGVVLTLALAVNASPDGATSQVLNQDSVQDHNNNRLLLGKHCWDQEQSRLPSCRPYDNYRALRQVKHELEGLKLVS